MTTQNENFDGYLLVHACGKSKITCPYCGEEIKIDSDKWLTKVCQGCLHVLVNEDCLFFKNYKLGRVPHNFIRFSVPPESVTELLFQALVRKTDAPLDLKNQCDISTVNKYWLPMVYFNGTLHAKGSGHITKKTRFLSKTSYDVADEFSILCSVCGNYSNTIPKEVLDFCWRVGFYPNELVSEKPVPYTFNDIVYSDADISMVSDFNDMLPPQQVWKTVGVKIAREQGESLIKEQADKEGATIDSKSVSIELNKNVPMDETAYIMVPFWHIEYTYKDEKYYFVTDGVSGLFDIKSPVDKRLKAVLDHCALNIGLTFALAIIFASWAFDRLDTIGGTVLYITVLYVLLTIIIAFGFRMKKFNKECLNIRTKKLK